MGTGQLSGKPDDMLGRRGGGGGGNLAVNQHSIQEGEVKLRVASCLGLLLVCVLSSYWESVLPFALEGSVYAVNSVKTY